jgi:hypothetical protein
MSPPALVAVPPRPAVTGRAVKGGHLTAGWRRCGLLRLADCTPVGIALTSGQSMGKAAGNRHRLSRRDLVSTRAIPASTSLVQGGCSPANGCHLSPWRLAFPVQITSQGPDRSGASRKGSHDHFVLSVANHGACA